jgi:hypothetical protein
VFQKLFVWPLFAAIMGFALGGSFVFGLYGPQATAQQISKNAEHHAAEQDAKSKKENTDEALAYYTLWLMVFTGILAVATVGLGGATLGLYFTGEKQIALTGDAAAAAQKAADVSELALISTQRAFVFVKQLVDPGPTTGDAPILVQWENSGTTPALNIIDRTNIVSMTDPMPDDYPFVDKTTKPHPNVASYLAPKAILHGPEIRIPAQIIERCALGGYYLYIYGWINYDDIFDKRHRTEFSYQVTVGTAHGNPGHRVLSFTPTRGHNAIDSDCLRQPAPFVSSAITSDQREMCPPQTAKPFPTAPA